MSNGVFPLTRRLISPAERREQELIVIASSTQTRQASQHWPGAEEMKAATPRGRSSKNAGGSKTVNWLVYLLFK